MARPGLSGAVAAFALLVLPVRAATLEVTVANLRNGTGDVRVAVCSPATFLKEKCEYNGLAPARAGETVVRVEGVPPGVWAVQAYHDEDRNTEVTRNLLGMPTEGIGFSNDAPFRFGPPTYADAAFQLGPAGGRIRLRLRYLF